MMANGCEGDLANDRLCQLPEDVLLSIMSSLTMWEGERIGLVSRQWNKCLWRKFPLLDFKEPTAMLMIRGNKQLLGQGRTAFLRRVDNVVEKHTGKTIDEFRVSFYLDISCQSHIDKWVVFALEKQVKRLNLDFLGDNFFGQSYYGTVIYYTLPLECCLPLKRPHNLTSLCLKNVNTTAEVIECFLRSCPLLENLSIDNSESLYCIKCSGASLPLKNLQVCRCCNMKTIDISAPKLLSFSYRGQYIELHIRDASLLAEVSFSCSQETLAAHVFDSLSVYFSQLKYLSLWIYPTLEVSIGLKHFAMLTNLKHLKLIVKGMPEESALGWIPLIEASPALQTLTLDVSTSYVSPVLLHLVPRVIGNRVGHPLKSLKTLEICYFGGSRLDLELAAYVVQNALMLQEVIVYFSCDIELGEEMNVARTCVDEVVKRSPSGAKRIFKGYLIRCNSVF